MRAPPAQLTGVWPTATTAPLAQGLDPRTQMLLIVLVSAAVMGPYGHQFLLAGLILAMSLAASEGAWRRVWVLPALVASTFVAAWALSHTSVTLLTASLMLSCDYMARIAITAAVSMHLFATTSPSTLHAALRAMRLPRPVAVTLIVMIRFLPVVIVESIAVYEAMRLYGLTGPRQLLRHPLSIIERFTVPLLTSALRAGEDLWASAILRGLGASQRPTSLLMSRLNHTDALWVLASVALGISAILVPEYMR